MKIIKTFLLLLLIGIGGRVHAQEFTKDMQDALVADDAATLKTLVSKEQINDCYGNYSLLSHAIQVNAAKCFDMLLDLGADVNKTCNGYIPPLMHAAKYGRLDMAKKLVAKGANVRYTYNGNVAQLKGHTPLTYAQQFNQTAVADYLKTIK